MHVLNSKHFTGMKKKECVEALVSFNVTSLFTNIPIDEAVDVKFTEEEEVEDLLESTPLPARRRGL